MEQINTEITRIAIAALQMKGPQANTPLADGFDYRFDTAAGTPAECAKLGEMLSAAKRFCSDMGRDHNPRFLSYLGKTGTGKTHLAKAITRFFRAHCEMYQHSARSAWLRRSGGRVEWRNVARWVREGDYGVLQDLGDDWFLCIDDAGAEHIGANAFTVSVLDELLNARLGKWTVITSNFTMEQIAERLDTRIASRLKRDDGEIVQIPSGAMRDYAYRQQQTQALKREKHLCRGGGLSMSSQADSRAND